jgi:hypothetical protein
MFDNNDNSRMNIDSD